jgi:hypothetical protein
MWTASAEPDHIPTAPATMPPLIMRRRPETEAIHHAIKKGDLYLKTAILVSYPLCEIDLAKDGSPSYDVDAAASTTRNKET